LGRGGCARSRGRCRSTGGAAGIRNRKAKNATDKAVDKGKDWANKAGEKVKETGQKIKDQGK
jgi:hypothetical protein